MNMMKQNGKMKLRLSALLLILAVCLSLAPLGALGAEKSSLSAALEGLADAYDQQGEALSAHVLHETAKHYTATGLESIRNNAGLGENCPTHDDLAQRIASLILQYYNPAILIKDGKVNTAYANRMLVRCYRIALAEYALREAMQERGDALIAEGEEKLGPLWKQLSQNLASQASLFELVLVEEAYEQNFFYKEHDKTHHYRPISAVAEELVAYCSSTYSLDKLIENDLLTQGLIYSYMRALGDKYSGYRTEEERLEEEANAEASFVGLGISLRTLQNSHLEVRYVYEGSPAEKAGILSGDLITHVDGKDLTEYSPTDAMSLIRGEGVAGVPVVLTILRGTEILEYTVTRASISNVTVLGRLLKDSGRKIGLVRISKFEATTYNEFVETVSDLKGQGAEAFIFDVRGNLGGDLYTVESMLAWLLPASSETVKDGAIVRLQYSSSTITMSEAAICYLWKQRVADGKLGAAYDPAQNQLDLPISVLCDESSASGAELFTSCLRDWGVAHVIGQKTLGKGVGQAGTFLRNLGSTGDGCTAYTGSYLYVTSFAYTPPLSKNYEGEGVYPDETVALSEEAKDLHFSKITPENDAMLKSAVLYSIQKIENTSDPMGTTILVIALTGIGTVTVILVASIVLTLILGKRSTPAPQGTVDQEQISDTSEHTKGE